MDENKKYSFNLETGDHNGIWKFVVTDSKLHNDDGSIKDKVIEIAKKANAEPNEEWDLIVYKDMVAFKLPTERITYIYTKKYWESRCFENLKNIKVLKF